MSASLRDVFFAIDVKLGPNGSRVVSVSGEFDAFAVSRFKEMTSALLADGSATMIVNLDRATYIDSAALGALIGLRKRLSECSGSLAIVCSNHQIRTVFEATGLLAVFRIREVPLAV